MKKTLNTMLAIFAIVFAGIYVEADEIDEAKADFKRQQEVCTTTFVKAWIDQRGVAELTTLFGNMARANARYSMACGGLDTSLTGSMIRACAPGKTEMEKFSLAICEYYRSKGLVLDTRPCFTRGSFKVWPHNRH
ncbi:MAG: hypothetical protein IJS08_01185 [Victivallales bacterium]|nr:hypothetical protein [Victivallales bacterium]